jgi:hypothetical protein
MQLFVTPGIPVFIWRANWKRALWVDNGVPWMSANQKVLYTTV